MKNTGLLYESVRYLGESLVPETNQQRTSTPWLHERDGWIQSSPRREVKPPQVMRDARSRKLQVWSLLSHYIVLEITRVWQPSG